MITFWCGPCWTRVCTSLDDLVEEFRKVGLQDHDIETPEAEVILGSFAPGSAVFGATGRWVRKEREAARPAVRRRTSSGRALELFVGHESFIAVGSRCAVSVLEAFCKFCRTTY